MSNRPDPSTLRADPFAVETEPDIASFKPTPARKPSITRDAIRQVSEQNNFPSREAPKAKPPKAKTQRRRRTGRNVQLNIKASQETIDRFLAVADRKNWVLGEALEHALAALEKTIS
jgi:hypothetical protein